MQLKICLQSDGMTLPVAYSHILHGLIYRALSENSELSERIHNDGFSHFTFSPLSGEYRVNSADKTITFPENADFEIRSNNDDIIGLLAVYFAAGKSVMINNRRVTVLSCLVSDYRVKGDSIEISMKSPVNAYITKKDRHTEFFSPDMPLTFTLIV